MAVGLASGTSTEEVLSFALARRGRLVSHGLNQAGAEKEGLHK